MTFTRRLALGLLVSTAALSWGPHPARAHCTAPDVIRPLFRTAAPDEILLFMSFGNALSQDGGKTWRILCEEAYQDPAVILGPNAVLLTPKGNILLPHFKGLYRTEDQGCTYATATGAPKDPDDMSIEVPVQHAELDPADPNNHAWVLYGQWLYETTDAGHTVKPVRQFTGYTLLRVLTDPSDAKVLYINSFVGGSGSTPTKNYLHYTLDGGATWHQEMSPFGSDEFTLLAANPTNPRELYVIRGFENQSLWRLDLQDPSGVKETKLFEVNRPELDGYSKRLFVAFGAPGELWAGVQGDDAVAGSGELNHSTDGGKTWKKIDTAQPHFRCLTFDHGRLFSCGNNNTAMGDAFAFAASDDGGQTWKKLLSFGELCDPLACIADKCASILKNVCVPGLCAQGGEDGGTDDAGADADGGPGGGAGGGGGSKDASVQDGGGGGGGGGSDGGGCCRAAGPGGEGAGLAAVALILAALIARRARRTR